MVSWVSTTPPPSAPAPSCAATAAAATCRVSSALPPAVLTVWPCAPTAVSTPGAITPTVSWVPATPPPAWCPRAWAATPISS